jgi:hypothetical protein
MTDSVELRGYLGETLVRGSTIYSRVVGTLLSTIQQSIAQKRLVVENAVPPRVELTLKGDVRLSSTFFFRLPPPGVGSFLPDAVVGGGVPLKFEVVSDYKIDPGTGLIYQHRLIETRINGQLTPGDLLSRSIQRILKLEQTTTTTNGNEDVLKTFSDALTWFRSMSSSGGGANR